MHMVMIQFKRSEEEAPRDLCVVRDKPSADRHTKALVEKYPAYKGGEFLYKKIKYIKA